MEIRREVAVDDRRNQAKEGTWNDPHKEIGNSGANLEEANRRQRDSSLGTSQKYLKTRIEADKPYRLNADRMKLKYCKAKQKKVHVQTFTRGDFVSIKIPRIDRTSTDFHHLPCVVVERLGSKYHLYRLSYVISKPFPMCYIIICSLSFCV